MLAFITKGWSLKIAVYPIKNKTKQNKNRKKDNILVEKKKIHLFPKLLQSN